MVNRDITQSLTHFNGFNPLARNLFAGGVTGCDRFLSLSFHKALSRRH